MTTFIHPSIEGNISVRFVDPQILIVANMHPACNIKKVFITVKPVFNSNSQKDHKLVFKTYYRLMHFKSIAECSKGSILQYIRSSLSYHLSL